MAIVRLSTHLTHKIFDLTLRNQAYTPPATVYIGLLTQEPSLLTDSYEEVVGASYTRETIAFSAPASRASSNSGIITFPEATEDWGTVSHWGLFDASTAGNLMYYGEFTLAREYVSGDIVSIPVGRIELSA